METIETKCSVHRTCQCVPVQACACLGYESICDILPGSLVMFCKFGPVYGSALQRFALIMGKCYQFIAIINIPEYPRAKANRGWG